MARSRI